MRKKYVIVAKTNHIAKNICHVYDLNELECVFISKMNYHEINSVPNGLIVFKECINHKDYASYTGDVKLDKKLKHRIYSFFELIRKKELKAILRKENRRQLKFKFSKKENLKDGDKILFRYKEVPNIFGQVNVKNNKLFINDIPLDEFDEIIYGSIRLIKSKRYESYLKLEEQEALNIYTHLINHKDKSINQAMQLLMQ